MLSACQARPPAEPAPATLTTATLRDAATLDPAAASDSESVEVVSQVYESLVRPGDGPGRVAPALAVSWKESADRLSWTFKLRQGVRFHDGAELDADAVVASLERQRDPKHRHHHGSFTYWQSLYGNIRQVERVSRHAVRIRLSSPLSPFLEYLALHPASIISPRALENRGRNIARRPAGTGPFRLERWDRGERVVLRRFDGYWGDSPRLSRLVFEVVPSAQRRLTLLESKRVQVAFSLSSTGRQVARLNPGLRLVRTPGNNVAYLALNTRSPFFKAVEARRAANAAIQRDALVRLVYQGSAVPASGPLPPGVPGFHKAVSQPAFDPAAARAALGALSLPSKPASLVVTSSPRPYLPAPVLAARMIQRQLAAVGLPVSLRVLPFPEYLAAVGRGEHDLCLAGWTGDIPDPDMFLWFLLGEEDRSGDAGARNLAMYRDTDLHGLLRRARRAAALPERERLYRQAQARISAAAPWVPLAHSDMLLATLKEVRGLRFLRTTTVSFAGAWLSSPGAEAPR